MSAPSPYAGAVSRLAAYVTDVMAIAASFTIGAASVAFLTRVVTGLQLDLRGDRDLAGIGLVLWWFTYFVVSWSSVGATPGMALLGLRVVRRDGSPVRVGRAVVRALVLSLNAALFGLGFLLILVQRQRRALHDLVAGTVVVHVIRFGVQERGEGQTAGRGEAVAGMADAEHSDGHRHAGQGRDLGPGLRSVDGDGDRVVGPAGSADGDPAAQQPATAVEEV